MWEGELGIPNRKEMKRGYVPVACVAIHSIGLVTRVGLQEDDCSVLVHGSGARADQVEIIEKPRDCSLIRACASL